MTLPSIVHTWTPLKLLGENDIVNRLFNITSTPAIRVWGDVLLEIAAERSGIRTTPDLALRRRALFPWRSSAPPLERRRVPTGRTQVALEVDGSSSALARHDLIDFVLDLRSWISFCARLSDDSHDAAVLAEELPPITNALAPHEDERSPRRRRDDSALVTGRASRLLRSGLD